MVKQILSLLEVNNNFKLRNYLQKIYTHPLVFYTVYQIFKTVLILSNSTAYIFNSQQLLYSIFKRKVSSLFY